MCVGRCSRLYLQWVRSRVDYFAGYHPANTSGRSVAYRGMSGNLCLPGCCQHHLSAGPVPGRGSCSYVVRNKYVICALQRTPANNMWFKKKSKCFKFHQRGITETFCRMFCCIANRLVSIQFNSKRFNYPTRGNFVVVMNKQVFVVVVVVFSRNYDEWKECA